MYDILQRIKLLIILIKSGEEHKLPEIKINKWKNELAKIIKKYENNKNYKLEIGEIINGMERNN